MRRVPEAALLAGSAAAAGLGAALVDFGKTGRIGLTAVVFLVVYGCCLGGMFWAVRRWAPGASALLLAPAAFLAALGLVEIYRIDPGQGSLHLWWLAAGVVGGIGVLVIPWDTARLASLGYVFATAGLCVTVGPFLPRLMEGWTHPGTGLWLTAGGAEGSVMFQPFVLGLALLAVGLAGIHVRWELSDAPGDGPDSAWAFRRHLVVTAGMWAVSLPLLWVTGDITAWAVVMVLSFSIPYLTTGRKEAVWTGLGLVAGGVLAGLSAAGVRQTLEIWVDPFGAGEAGGALREGLLAVGTGSLVGSGLGIGDPGLIPFATSDWILAALGEELGLAGTVAIIALWSLMIAGGMRVALSSRDLFSKVTAASLTVLLAVTFVAAAGGLERLVPPTRLGLPFLAYGGFPVITGWLAVAVLLRISHEEQGSQ